MTHGSLFSGIGGFDLAAEWMGWENKFHCEKELFCQKILKHYWPKAELFTDIKTANFERYTNTIDIISGGFPCQPYSTAGKQQGRNDERHLWPFMLNAIRVIRPRWVVGENVRGLVSWDGGVVFDEVQSDLEVAGYEVIPFLLPACGVNAPHQRYRVWFVAYASSERGFQFGGRSSVFNGNGVGENEEYQRQQQSSRVRRCSEISIAANSQQFQERASLRDRQDTEEEGTRMDDRIERSGDVRDAPDTETKRMERGRAFGEQEPSISFRERVLRCDSSRTDWTDWPTQSPLCFRDDGISPRLDGITFPKWRAESIKSAGNAIVPQVVYQIFKSMEQFSTNEK